MLQYLCIDIFFCAQLNVKNYYSLDKLKIDDISIELLLAIKHKVINRCK